MAYLIAGQGPRISTPNQDMAAYTSCSCNRVPHCVDWGNNNIICFGTCNAIAIYHLYNHIGRVTHTLHRHRNRVNSVQWIRSRSGASESELLSGSVDGTVIIWSKDEHYSVTSVLEIGEVVTFIDSLQVDSDDVSSARPELLICTGSVSGEVKLWQRNKTGKIEKIQSISFGRKLGIYCRLTYLPNTKDSFLLAIALEDASVVLHVKDSTALESTFVKVLSLSRHEDWVTCMDFCHNTDGECFLATGSQDSMIRLWKISETVAESPSNELRPEQDTFVVNNKEYNVTLESVLNSHEHWIYGVHWHLTKATNGNNCQRMRLLSASFDKSMIIWELDDTTGIWTEKVCVGEVGGNSLGFYGCKFGPDGLHMLAHGYQGSFHIWKYCEETSNWIPWSTPGGHFSEVVDLCWDPEGRSVTFPVMLHNFIICDIKNKHNDNDNVTIFYRFLLTASTDQTTRIHAPWKDSIYFVQEFWHEIARPQVHGYDMSCLVMLSPYMYASGAEEKVVRVFTATSAFKNRLGLLTNVEDFNFITAHGATVPSLGLTNKATFDETSDQCENKEKSPPLATYKQPTEEELMQNTLWPELQKLYGHGYEIFCMAAKHDGQLLATACKSTNKEHAAIILWNTNTWSQVDKLIAHELTVTQMQFSPNDKYLLAVSRDRRWSLYKNKSESYSLITISPLHCALHSRVIWCCAWTRDSKYFATGSRDKKIGIWSTERAENNPDEITPDIVLDTHFQSVTALCFTQRCVFDYRPNKPMYILAVGYEAGHIEIQVIETDMKHNWTTLNISDIKAHDSVVKRLMFRPRDMCPNNSVQLASCSSSHFVKIHTLYLPDILCSVP